MENEQRSDLTPAELQDQVFRQAYAEENITLLDDDQHTIIAQIEELLLANGRTIEDIYQEWEQCSTVEVIARYATLLENHQGEVDTHKPVKSTPLSGELHVSFAGFKEHPFTGAFWINNSGNLPAKVLVFRIDPALRKQVISLKDEDPVALHLELHGSETGREIFVQEIRKEKHALPTFPATHPKPYVRHYPADKASSSSS